MKTKVLGVVVLASVLAAVLPSQGAAAGEAPAADQQHETPEFGANLEY